MSPRAAWRLESLAFTDVYDFVPGKMAWLAMGWAREGKQASKPNAGEVVRKDVPTCRLDEPFAQARQRVDACAYDFCLVTNDQGIFMGRLRGDALSRDGEALARDAMEAGSTTTRPSEALEGLTERMSKHRVKSIVITDLQGRLMGAFMREDGEKVLETQQSGEQ